jgi:hypothetical protein
MVLARGLASRFFGSLLCGVVLVEAFGAAALYQPHTAADSWSDMFDDVARCGVIGLIAGTSVGFGWCLVEAIRQFLRRAKPSIRRGAGWTIAILLGLWIVGFALCNALLPGKPFDAAEWQEREARHNGSRQQMADRLVAWRVLDGKTRAEVRSMLGNPNWPSEDSRQLYFLGRERTLLGPLDASARCEWLAVEFGQDDRVARCHIGALSHCGCLDETEKPRQVEAAAPSHAAEPPPE